MANELYFKIQGRYTPANTNTSPTGIGVVEKYITQTGADHQAGTQSVGTTEETVSWIADIGDEGYIFLRNLDATNYIQFGFSTGVYGMRLKPGEFAVLRLEPGATLYAKANTAAVNIQYIVYED
jgi:hypothetical protein